MKKTHPQTRHLSLLVTTLVMTVLFAAQAMAGGGAGSSGGSGGSGGSTRTVNTGTHAVTTDRNLANQTARDLNSGAGGYRVPAGSEAVVVTGANGTVRVDVRPIDRSSGNGSASVPPGGTTLPAPSTLSLVAEINDGSDYSANATIRVAPSDKIDLSWNSSGATTCTNNFGGSGLNNTRIFNPNAIMPGTSRLFQMSCTGVGGSIARTITAEVPGVVINLTADKKLVRYGETVTYSWTVALSSPLSSGPSTTPYPMNCILNGGASRTFNAATQPTGSITSEALTNSRQTTLTCTETAAGTGYRVSNSTIVEIIPRSEET